MADVRSVVDEIIGITADRPKDRFVQYLRAFQGAKKSGNYRSKLYRNWVLYLIIIYFAFAKMSIFMIDSVMHEIIQKGELGHLLNITDWLLR